MNSKIKSALLIGALLVTSSTQVYAWGDYDGGWGDYDGGWGDDDSDWTHTHDSKCGHKTYSVPAAYGCFLNGLFNFQKKFLF